MLGALEWRLWQRCLDAHVWQGGYGKAMVRLWPRSRALAGVCSAVAAAV